MPKPTPDESVSAHFRSNEINARIVASQQIPKKGEIHKTSSVAVTAQQCSAEIGNLPATAKELIEVIGLDEFIALVKEFAGGDLKIPEVANGTSKYWDYLVEIVGDQAAKKIVWRYAGTMIYIPTCRLLLLVHRDREIIRRFDAGEKLEALRREFNISRRHMYRVLKKPL